MDDAASGRTVYGLGEEARPRRLSWQSWKALLFRVKDEVLQDRVGTVAAGTAFFILLAIFPAVAALVSLYGLVADPAAIRQHLMEMRGFVPTSLLDMVGRELDRLLGNRSGTLGVSFVGGMLLALWSANNGMRALFEALNVAYDATERRGFLRLRLVSMGFTLGALVFLVLVINLVIGIPLILRFLDLGPLGDVLVAILPALVMFGVALFGLAVLYRYGPDRARPHQRWITSGSLLAAAIWLVFSILFSWYLSNWTDYSATYGSLGTVIGVMMWIYLSLWVVLIGAELNAEVEHQRALDAEAAGDDLGLLRDGAPRGDSTP